MSFQVGEALVGDGNELAHIDLIIGDKNGPAGIAFVNALSTQSQGDSNLLTVLEPNLDIKPTTELDTKVTIQGANHSVQMLTPEHHAFANAWRVFSYSNSNTKGISFKRILSGQYWSMLMFFYELYRRRSNDTCFGMSWFNIWVGRAHRFLEEVVMSLVYRVILSCCDSIGLSGNGRIVLKR